MSEWIKTSLYVVAGLGVVGLAVAAERFATPSVSKAFEQLGTSFYPEFDKPLAARSLEVVSYNPETSVIREFHVNWGENGWTISPYGYPADAQEQLEKTAASVVGITRAGLASRRASDFAKYGVVGPRSEDLSKLSGRGQRIILKDKTGQVLLDLIIGDPAEGRDGYYYVRKPKENDTYVAKVDIDLSTQFSDWINSDLLEVRASDLQKIRIADYSVNSGRGVIETRSQSVLTKEEQFGPWTLKDFSSDTKELDTAAVNKLTQALAKLKIIGVRPKPEGVNADLSIDREKIRNDLFVRLLRQSLSQKGFYYGRAANGGYQIFGKEGKVTAVTGDGIAYDLYFGEQFTGSRFEIEFGSTEKTKSEAPSRLPTNAKETAEANAEADGAGSPSRSEETTTGDDSSSGEEEPADEESSVPKTGRYLFVSARFAPEQLDKPEPPEPASTDASKKEKEKAQQAQTKYKQALAEYEKKVANAKETVKNMNERFGDWFYVISTENFEDLRLSRKALLMPKEKEKEQEKMARTQQGDSAEATANKGKETSTRSPTNASGGGPVTAPKPTAGKSADEKVAKDNKKSAT